ncbi:MAG: rhamnogalacturonan acetylesterase [Bacteroidetes bacterium]|nr:rhamnogalacturonan acetylesterase [Bacteroidota bacterium]MCB0853823.1 rhamnogalacturonan acetylesterase [Bacteroidota bacterium]
MKLTLKLTTLFFFCILTGFTPLNQPEIHIFLIGDSTMADKPGTPEENPERGWGQLLHTFFNENAAIHNHAVNGRSSKSFISEGRWEKVLEELSSGDYVFIQFGHNDQKDQDPTRYTNPWSSYRRNLERFVKETRARGAYPVLLSSIVRRKFNDQGTLVDTHGPYPFVAQWVAYKMDVPFIDMQGMTEDYVNEIGIEKSKEIYLWVEPGEYERFPDGREDNTHLSLTGATEYARLVAEEIKRQELALGRFLE